MWPKKINIFLPVAWETFDLRVGNLREICWEYLHLPSIYFVYKINCWAGLLCSHCKTKLWCCSVGWFNLQSPKCKQTWDFWHFFLVKARVVRPSQQVVCLLTASWQTGWCPEVRAVHLTMCATDSMLCTVKNYFSVGLFFLCFFFVVVVAFHVSWCSWCCFCFKLAWIFHYFYFCLIGQMDGNVEKYVGLPSRQFVDWFVFHSMMKLVLKLQHYKHWKESYKGSQWVGLTLLSRHLPR